ncbi:MAG: peptidoglycan-binding domain-containing protein [Myxococcota bacterium]
MTSIASTRPSTSSAAPRAAEPLGASLEAAANGQHLRRGQSSEGVRELQKALNARGFRLEEDGKFGPATEAAVRQFQQVTGAKVDGVVGPETVGKLRNAGPSTVSDYTPPTPTQPTTINPTTTGTEREQYEMYASMIRRAGGEVCPNGQPTVLGLRQGVGGSTRRYDDQFIVLTPDGRVQRFSGATHPGQNSSRASPDVTGDGQGDVGMIRPGNYRVVPNGDHAGAPSFHVRTLEGSGNLPGWRDTNHDGSFSDRERTGSESRRDTLNGVLFHQGGSNSPTSIGCQTMSPAEYRRFLDAVGGPRASFTYTLVSV